MNMEMPPVTPQLAQLPPRTNADALSTEPITPTVSPLRTQSEGWGNSLDDFPDFGWQPHPDQNHSQLGEGDTHVYVGANNEGQTVYALIDTNDPPMLSDANTSSGTLGLITIDGNDEALSIDNESNEITYYAPSFYSDRQEVSVVNGTSFNLNERQWEPNLTTQIHEGTFQEATTLSYTGGYTGKDIIPVDSLPVEGQVIETEINLRWTF